MLKYLKLLCVCVRSGFREDYPYPHAHTLFITEAGDTPKLQPEQLRAKLLMFAFGNALARARALYGVRAFSVTPAVQK